MAGESDVYIFYNKYYTTGTAVSMPSSFHDLLLRHLVQYAMSVSPHHALETRHRCAFFSASP